MYREEKYKKTPGALHAQNGPYSLVVMEAWKTLTHKTCLNVI